MHKNHKELQERLSLYTRQQHHAENATYHRQFKFKFSVILAAIVTILVVLGAASQSQSLLTILYLSLIAMSLLTALFMSMFSFGEVFIQRDMEDKLIEENVKYLSDRNLSDVDLHMIKARAIESKSIVAIRTQIAAVLVPAFAGFVGVVVASVVGLATAGITIPHWMFSIIGFLGVLLIALALNLIQEVGRAQLDGATLIALEIYSNQQEATKTTQHKEEAGVTNRNDTLLADLLTQHSNGEA